MILFPDKTNEEMIKELKKEHIVKYEPQISRGDLLEKVKDAEVLVVRGRTRVDKELIDNARKLKLVIRAGVGLDNIDLEYAKQKKVQIKNTPLAPSTAVAEQAMTLTLTLLKNTPYHDTKMKQGEWSKAHKENREIRGKTIGILGLGNIGKAYAELAKPFGPKKIIGLEIRPIECAGVEITKSLDDVLEQSDIISIHLPLTKQTRGMLGKKEFKKMKKGVYIINTSRGAIINKQELKKNLETGKVVGAGLDVYWEEPFDGTFFEEVKEKVVLSPHIGSSTPENQKRIGREVIKIIKEYFEKGEKMSLEEKLTEALEKGGSTQGIAWLATGIANLRTGNYQKAIECYDRAIKSGPRLKKFCLSLAHAERGLAKKRLEGTKGAEEDYKEALELNPILYREYYEWGNKKLAKRNYEEAVHDYDMALELNPKFSAAMLNRAIAKTKLGKYKEAEEDYIESKMHRE